jgi:DNA (cytosine-5)-methyltransferase 1
MDLGLERAGMVCRWQAEIDPFCRKVLEKDWPKVRRYEDVKGIDEGCERVDLIAGGFPCQDISYAGYGAGLDGDRSGLWWEFARVIRILGPSLVIVENVAALLNRGMGDVLGTLSSLGYDAEWSVVSACSVGHTHMRRRMFIVAHANGVDGRPRVWNLEQRRKWKVSQVDSFARTRADQKARLANPSELYRGADGVPFGMDRNRAIGNSVPPQVAEWIGRRIMQISVCP